MYWKQGRLFAYVLFALALTPVAHAQQGRAEALIKRLQSGSSEARERAAQDIYGAGIVSKPLYDELAKILTEGLDGLDKKSARIDELAWEVKALGSSGDMSYMPVIEAAIASNAGSLPRHAKSAKETLEEAAANGKPYLTWEKVPVITERQAESCQYVSQGVCETARSGERCVAQHQVRAVDAGANAVMVMHSTSTSGGLTMWGASTTMLASYYMCE